MLFKYKPPPPQATIIRDSWFCTVKLQLYNCQWRKIEKISLSDNLIYCTFFLISKVSNPGYTNYLWCTLAHLEEGGNTYRIVLGSKF